MLDGSLKTHSVITDPYYRPKTADALFIKVANRSELSNECMTAKTRPRVEELYVILTMYMDLSLIHI